MNTRKKLLDLLEEVLKSRDYNVSTVAELPSAVSLRGFPMAVVGEPKLVVESAVESNVITYDIVVKMLIQRQKPADKSAPSLAIIEQDALWVAERVAEAEAVVGLTLRELAPIAGGVTHAGDVAMAMSLRVELFRVE
ncbi:MAG: hypothetical protein J6K78_05500 [Tidjanibacter sp.]|nr:hypothetical protein [Tidjanibacter sp.]